jgi:Rad3-related DNA helicase
LFLGKPLLYFVQQWHERSELKNGSKVIYLSRTHSQIAQVVKELKRTEYNPVMVVLGSKEQLCINSEAEKSSKSRDEKRKELLEK